MRMKMVLGLGPFSYHTQTSLASFGSPTGNSEEPNLKGLEMHQQWPAAYFWFRKQMLIQNPTYQLLLQHKNYL
ncbi:MAG TPA: hypothetical protein VLB04_08820, partial [Methanotrichaceae archaeon]|nr:hypothetical protein [Methanotrichaceae archaeon]